MAERGKRLGQRPRDVGKSADLGVWRSLSRGESDLQGWSDVNEM
jgi:hypothetical protein